MQSKLHDFLAVVVRRAQKFQKWPWLCRQRSDFLDYVVHTFVSSRDPSNTEHNLAIEWKAQLRAYFAFPRFAYCRRRRRNRDPIGYEEMLFGRFTGCDRLVIEQRRDLVDEIRAHKRRVRRSAV